MSKYNIIGGGLSGLAAGCLLKDSEVLESGVLTSPWNLNSGPMWLHDDEPVRRLLKQIDVPIKGVLEMKIGVFWDGKLGSPSDFKSDAKLIQEHHIRKTRKCGLEDLPEQESIMNWKRDVCPILDVDYDVLWQRLSSTNVKQLSPVSAIRPNGKLFQIGSENAKIYDKIISTVPLPVLGRLLGDERVASLPYTDVLIYEMQAPFDTLYDYVYFPGENTVFHRITGRFVEVSAPNGADKDRVGKEIEKGLEAVGIDTKLTKYWPNVRSPGYFLPTGVDVEKIIVQLEQVDVYCVGRFAEWDHEIKLSEVIQKVERTRDDTA